MIQAPLWGLTLIPQTQDFLINRFIGARPLSNGAVVTTPSGTSFVEVNGYGRIIPRLLPAVWSQVQPENLEEYLAQLSIRTVVIRKNNRGGDRFLTPDSGTQLNGNVT